MFKLRKASSQVGNMPLTLLTFAVVAIVGVLVFANVFEAIPALTGDANTTIYSFADSFYSGIGLLGVALIVLGDSVEKMLSLDLCSSYYCNRQDALVSLNDIK